MSDLTAEQIRRVIAIYKTPVDLGLRPRGLMPPPDAGGIIWEGILQFAGEHEAKIIPFTRRPR